MSGTSLDGVDYALCDIGQAGKISLAKTWSARFPRTLLERLRAAAGDEASVWELAQLHHDLGRFYARHASKGGRVELVGLHGQTVFHNPCQPSPASLQIGEPAFLSEALRAPVVSNFRAADLAAGGEGAPLAPIFHAHLFAQRGKAVAVQNLGGIANVTWIDWVDRSGAAPRIFAFDTGSGNILIDLAMKHVSKGKLRFDKNGTFARKGQVKQSVLRDWLEHPFFLKKPPKSTGRELFGEAFLERALRSKMKAEDLIATVTELTARSIALAYQRHLPRLPVEVVLCGGGVKNSYLSDRIADALQRVSRKIVVRTTAEYGWDAQFIEAAAFALLAWLTIKRRPGNVPSATGARGPRVLGQVTATFTS